MNDEIRRKEPVPFFWSREFFGQWLCWGLLHVVLMVFAAWVDPPGWVLLLLGFFLYLAGRIIDLLDSALITATAESLKLLLFFGNSCIYGLILAVGSAKQNKNRKS